MAIELESKESGKPNRLKSIYGAAKGKVWMADDFDQPLDDFAEYMSRT